MKYIKIENKKLTNMTNNTFTYDYNENSPNLKFRNSHSIYKLFWTRNATIYIYEVQIQITNLNF